MESKTQSVVFARESLATFLDEALPLLYDHWREIAKYQDIELKPNLPFYYRSEEAGCLRVHVLRVNGALVGYGVYIVGPNPHYSDSLQAVQDILFVRKDHRLGRLGIKLIEFSEQLLREEGVQVIHQHAKLEHPALAQILQRRGYTAVDVIYSKRLDQ